MRLLKKQQENALAEDEHIQRLIQQITRDFDDKLFMLCADVSACKTMFSQQLNQPFYRCAQWLWKSGQLKLGSAVPWNIQASNTGT